MAVLKRPAALSEWVPYEDPEEPELPSYAEASMLGQCPEHGLERITHSTIRGGTDRTTLYHFACGEVDPTSFA